MTKQNDCAYPADQSTQTESGLTKREYFAAMAMQGLLSSGRRNTISSLDEVIKDSVVCAEQLIYQLNKQVYERNKI